MKSIEQVKAMALRKYPEQINVLTGDDMNHHDREVWMSGFFEGQLQQVQEYEQKLKSENPFASKRS